MTDLHEQGVTDLLATFASGAADPRDAVAACLARIDATDDGVHAWFRLSADAALAAAESSSKRWIDGVPRPLEGVPFGVKDVIDTAGVVTTAGSQLYADHVPARSATAVRRLEDAGAILIGKTATPEFAFGDEISETPVANPWAPDRWVGGSSSGSAAAVAARQVPLCLGTDTGGSIRVPSSYCGVTGLKPTMGRVPRDGLHPVSWSFDHIGPIARSVDDIVAALSALAGHADEDSRSSRRPADEVLPTPGGLDGLRVGVAGGWFTGWGDPAVSAARDAAVEVLAGLGASVVPVDVSRAEVAGTVAWIITVVEFAANHEAVADDLERISASAMHRFIGGARLSALDYLKARQVRVEIQQELTELFGEVDVIVTPATPTPAPSFDPAEGFFEGGDRLWLDKVARCFLIANVTGIPAMVLPAGVEGGLPLSVQFLGRPFDEATLLRAGREFQRVTTHHLAAPADVLRR